VAQILDRFSIGTRELTRHRLLLLEADVGLGDGGVGEAGNGGFHLLAVFRHALDDAEVQSVAHAGRNAGRLEADLKPVDTHVALLYLSFHRIKLWSVDATDPGAVATAETGVRILQHRAILRMLGIGIGRAALEAYRIIAMVTCHRDVHAGKRGIRSTCYVAH